MTDTQVKIPPGVELISATDCRGVITYANDDLVRISGFTREELIGSSHNIVRHPDMPPAAFQNLWDTLKQGKPWMGLVKNRCKNGDYYWVDAFVTPSRDGEHIVGYESVRVAPDSASVQRAEQAYRSLWAKGKGLRLLRPGLLATLTGALSLAGAVVLGGAAALGAISTFAAVLLWLALSIAGAGAAHFALADLRSAAAQAHQVADNPVMQQIYTGRTDDTGALLFAAQVLQARLRTVLGRMGQTAHDVKGESDRLCATAGNMSEHLGRQQREIDMIATAAEQMSVSVSEVARNATSAADAIANTNRGATAGHQAVQQAETSTHQVAEGMAQATATIQTLEQDSQAIGEVLNVIRGIAEQTNLLALNAAIEAARAGEQGRGFAVVADEVRTLASRTQSSTTEIESMIDRLQSTARQAVNAMEDSGRKVTSSVEQTQQVAQQLSDIFVQIASLEDVGRSIATAAEQQSSVSAEIAQNVSNICVTSSNLAEGGQVAQNISVTVANKASELEALIRRFRV